MPVYKLHKEPETTSSPVQWMPVLGDVPTTPAECISLLQLAYKASKLADKTIRGCKLYAEQSGETILRGDETPWVKTTARTVQKYSATIDEVLALLVRCGVPTKTCKQVEAELIEQGVGSEKISERWEPWK